MEKVPRGRYSRFDTHKYTRTEIVRILNRELESKGFRLLERGDYLVVLELDSLRSRYRRPVVPVGGASRSDDAKGAPTAPRRLPTPSGSEQGERPAGGSTTMQPATDTPAETRPGSREHPADDGPSEESRNDAPHGGKQPSSHEVKTVRLRQRTATNVARIIYTALKPRAKLIDDGPQGLPGFVVSGSSPESRETATDGDASVNSSEATEQFSVGIDVDHEELVISASPKWSQTVADLIGLLDEADPPGKGGTIRLVASETDVQRVADNLQPALQRMTAQRSGGRGRRSDVEGRERIAQREQGSQPTDGQQQPPRAPSPPDGQQARPPVPDGEPLLRIDALRGPVTIQDVPGIGLVVTGNREDVDAVVRIIRELERVAGGVVPDIHLLLLSHVNSEALASLLNNVYEELTAIRSVGAQQQPSASIIPVVKPNAILIVASQGDLEAIQELAEKLDQPVDPGTEFQVFPLKNAVASQVVSTLESLYAEEEEDAGLRTRVRVVADARTNSVIVEAAPRDLAAVAKLIRKIDRDSSGSVSRMRVFPLKNAVAEELAEVINTALQSVLNPAAQVGQQAPGQAGVGAAAGQQAQELQDVKSVVLEFLSTDGEAQKLVRSGILADIRVTADPRVNALLVTAPEQSMQLMAELIRQLDQPPSAVAEIKVFTLTNADATAMADLLETLFQSEEQQEQLGIQVAGAEDASSSLIPLRVSVDVRTNSIIAMGGTEALRVVEAILLRLDETDVRQRKTTVIRLKNSPVIEVADAINAFLQSQRDLAQIDPELVSNIELLEREIIVVPEPVTNTLLISATPRYFEEVLDIVSELDKAPAQVIIQVLIVEVELNRTDEFGVELGFQDSLLFDRGLLNLENFQTIQETTTNTISGVATTTQRIVNQETIPGFLFNNEQLGNNTAVNPSSVGTQGLSNFSLGRVNGDLGFGGLVLSASSESISVLIRALAAQRNVHILSRPQIRTLDNQLAQIQVGQQVPVISGATTNQQGGITPVLGTPQQVGIILQVTPRISPDGTIVMETIANKSAISPEGVPIITDPTTGAVVESPIFDLTEAQATVAVPDGQTVVLGGMITKEDDTLERKVPWLGDLPLLGTAFRFDSTNTTRTELLIFMTPRIIKNDIDSELIKQVEAERIHFLEQEAEKVHGPIFAVPPEDSMQQFPPPMTAPSPTRPSPQETNGPSMPESGIPGEFPVRPQPDNVNPDGLDGPAGAGWRGRDRRSGINSSPAARSYEPNRDQGVPTTIMPAEPQSFSVPQNAPPRAPQTPFHPVPGGPGGSGWKRPLPNTDYGTPPRRLGSSQPTAVPRKPQFRPLLKKPRWGQGGP